MGKGANDMTDKPTFDLAELQTRRDKAINNHEWWICSTSDLLAAYAAGERFLTGAYLTGASLRGANLTGANLTEANLRGASLTEANLTGAYLRGAYLRGANLRGANLTEAYLRGANLTGASLTGASLRGADLRGANLTEADLTRASLTEADLRGANLTGADLTRASLKGANLTGADLTNTCLDPQAVIPTKMQETLRKTFDVDANGYFIAYRTRVSLHITPETEYEVGKEYIAPVFSVSTETDCHPGRYFATQDWLNTNEGYADPEWVTVRVHISDALAAWDKFRCRKFTVIAGDPRKAGV